MKRTTFIKINKNKDDWWLNTKAELISKIIDNQTKINKKKVKILDVASGTGFVASKVEQKGYQLVVSDRSKTALRILRKKFKTVLSIDLPESIKTREKFDVILVLDVLEYIENDYLALRNIKKLLKKNGVIIITVPAFEFLWSQKDIRVEHKRRYIKFSLKRLINESSLNIRYISYYNFLLFVPALIYSLSNKNKEIIPRYNHLQNLIFQKIFSLEIPIILNKFKLPFGVSLIAIVSK